MTPAGKLTTHVLDTAHGRPAGGLHIELYRLSSGEPGGEAGGEANAAPTDRTHLGSFTTNADGRTDAPLLAGPDLVPGVYELVFHVGAYFAGTELELGTPPFLNTVPVRFGVDDATAGYHVPLLASPYGYSTYRGS